MRIGIDCRMFQKSFTGIGRYTYELVNTLQSLSKTDQQAQAHEFVLFLNDPEYSDFTPPSSNFKKVLASAPHYSLDEQTRFLKILNAEKLDLMHFTHFNAPIRYKKPFVVTIHDLTHTLFPGRKMRGLPYRLAYKAVIKNAVKKAKRVIAISKNTKNDLIEILRVPSYKIDVIYEAAGSEFRQVRPEDLGTTAKIIKEKYNIGPPFLLYTGVHRYHKNLPRLIEAFAKLAQKHQVLKLVMTGKPDPLYPEAQQKVEELGLSQSVVFPGLVSEEELIALYNLATAYVFPSLYEGFGLPVLEAMQCGTPVIASNTSSIPEIAGKSKDGTPNAILFNPEEPEDMAEKIDQVLTDPNLQIKLIEKGLSRAKDFSWEKMTKEILALYNQQ
jgi:glycosyltransferase involved in cell wall biosynthesis